MKQCTCTPTDLQPFGECICGAEGSSRDFEYGELHQYDWHLAQHLNASQEELKKLQDDMIMYGKCKYYVSEEGFVKRVHPIVQEDFSRVIKMTKDMEEKRNEIVKQLANKVARDLGITDWNKNLAEAPTTEYILFVVDGEVKYGQKRNIGGEYFFEDLTDIVDPYMTSYARYSTWEVEKWMLVPKP